MPIYVYREKTTGDVIEEYYPIGEAPAAIRHPVMFNRWYERVYTPLGIKIDKGTIYSPAFGKHFKNEKDQTDYAKHHGFTPVENASLESIHKWEADQEKDREKKVDIAMADVVQSFGG